MREGAAFMEGCTVAMLGDGKAPVELRADEHLIQRYVAKYTHAA